MATNLSIDNDLLNHALQIGKLKTKKDTVNLALKEFISRRETADIINLFGTIAYDSEYDYKKARLRRGALHVSDGSPAAPGKNKK